MADLVRFGISIPGPLLGSFDTLIEGAGYANRSEAIRDLIRSRLVDAAWEGGAGEMIGTLTLVYDHHVHELGDALTGISEALIGMRGVKHGKLAATSAGHL